MQTNARRLIAALVLTLGLGLAVATLGGVRHAATPADTASSATSTASADDLSWG
ncbi:hypothetical protein KDK95_05345 [Actinospica sp. MGRD01-02]|uniref:Uncharacterized protein n=1 Tax=Actinospica acidithermotolerans TaxID=2828514 RepID=A0A941EDB4_9ACTN|nr:hypothetical protein [Actinospica acidithermotolerans]MBR7825724.1 hypothetical protein [Actinospica acidithermotolerans]